MLINDLIKGNKKFREVSFPKYEGNLKDLVEMVKNLKFFSWDVVIVELHLI
jgi:chromatin segregation and condensation protein Rec8/ScpA/Scc1 (kleisin family)